MTQEERNAIWEKIRRNPRFNGHELWVLFQIACGDYVGMRARPGLVQRRGLFRTSFTSGRSRLKAYHSLLARGYFTEVLDDGQVVGQRLTRLAEKRLKVKQHIEPTPPRGFAMWRTRAARVQPQVEEEHG